MFFDCLINICKQQSSPKNNRTTNFFPCGAFDSRRNSQAHSCGVWFFINTAEETLSHPLKKPSSCLVSKSPLPVFLIDSPRSRAAHWHGIRDYEVRRAALSVLAVWTVNIRSCQGKENKKVIAGGFLLTRRSLFLRDGSKVYRQIQIYNATTACWCAALISGHSISQPKTQTHPIITERGGEGGVADKVDRYHNNPAPTCNAQRLLDETC